MATAATDNTDSTVENEPVIMTGLLTKQGGNYRNWKERHFVLRGTTLSYYKNKEDTKPKGVIDLTTGRGVRTMKYVTDSIEWPDDVKANYAFAIATSIRTYYIYGRSSKEIQKWKTVVKEIIDTHGTPTSDWKNDIEGKPEHIASKIAKKVAKIGAQVTKKVAAEYIQDDNIASIVEGVADGVENQADADRNATIGDRLKRGAGDAVGVAGSGIQLASEYVPDEIGQTAVYTAGGIIRDQGTADTDASITERIAIGVGSAAEGIGECHEEASVVTDVVSKVAEKTTETLEENRAEEEEEEKQKKLEQDSDEESDDECDENLDTSGI